MSDLSFRDEAASGAGGPRERSASKSTVKADARVDLSIWMSLGGRLDSLVIELARGAEEAKARGNVSFSAEAYDVAADSYTRALELVPLDKIFDDQRGDSIGVVDDCTAALEFKPKYAKVLLRRATAYEKLDKLDEALEDFDAVLKLEPKNPTALEGKARNQAAINTRNEKLKTEMMDKLKGFGNAILGKFGLSLDNFQMQQDPNTGSYSINFKQ